MEARDKHGFSGRGLDPYKAENSRIGKAAENSQRREWLERISHSAWCNEHSVKSSDNSGNGDEGVMLVLVNGRWCVWEDKGVRRNDSGSWLFQETMLMMTMTW